MCRLGERLGLAGGERVEGESRESSEVGIRCWVIGAGWWARRWFVKIRN